MNLYNTASRKTEEFQPLNPPNVSIYSCGPTVYDFTHLGHLRTYTNNDILKRTLACLGYRVNHVMNITDVGHLTGDDDSGEDKLEKGAKNKGVDIWSLIKTYTDYFFMSIAELNIKRPNNFYAVTDHIREIILFVENLERKGFVYQTDEAVYFDITKFENYGKLSGQKLSEKILGAREDVHIDIKKKNPADFALWFKIVGRFKNHIMKWPSPWGDGFPGWHIECSAIIGKYLGDTIDIHTGGVDHVTVHHENEKAQSEAATGKPFVKYWVHSEFLMVDGKKMSKSLGNFYTIDDVKKKGFEPMSLRLLFLQTHYRHVMNFTWESIEASATAYKKIKNYILGLKKEIGENIENIAKIKNDNKFKRDFISAIADDLNMPKALAIFWEVLKSDISSSEKLALICDFDNVLGLGFNDLSEEKEEKIPEDMIKIVNERENARKNKDFSKADELRRKINEKGYEIKDTEGGYKITKLF